MNIKALCTASDWFVLCYSCGPKFWVFYPWSSEFQTDSSSMSPPQMFDSKAELQIHTQVHMREAKPYKCSHCPKSFANSSYLSQHMRIHLGIKPFGPCQYCGRKFTQLSHLQQHLRTHTGEKPYKCRYPGCEKAFSQLSNLQSHSRCHQTDKPYKCNRWVREKPATGETCRVIANEPMNE
ncbi:unnamed protein product [Soboliphyme baturini]|uniref:Zinc finger protein 582 n=1 Tax=Soboliphyme baturini TaxID=241478 RepID=A0A183IF16_9BILA|nr:unnamed protein product [Soboliphyme baturini]